MAVKKVTTKKTTKKAMTKKVVKPVAKKVHPVKSSSPSEIVPKAISQGKPGISQSEIISRGKKTEKANAIKAVKKAVVPKIEIEKIVTPKVETKKVEKKIEKPVRSAGKPSTPAGKYFYAVGRRKTASAQVRLFANDKATDDELIINGKKMKDYFPVVALQNNLLAPLKAVGMQGKFGMSVIVRGGGVTGQVEGIRLGIARALVKYDESLKKSLKDLGLMTRDSREVERKKPGLKKARKAPQWAKR